MTLISRRRAVLGLIVFAFFEFVIVSVTLSFYAPELGGQGIFVRALWSFVGMINAALWVALIPSQRE